MAFLIHCHLTPLLIAYSIFAGFQLFVIVFDRVPKAGGLKIQEVKKKGVPRIFSATSPKSP